VSTYIDISNMLAKNSEDATNGLQLMLDTSKKIHELSLQMGGLTVSAEESAKKSIQLEQVIQLIPLLQESAMEVREISHGIRTAELREQGMGWDWMRDSLFFSADNTCLLCQKGERPKFLTGWPPLPVYRSTATSKPNEYLEQENGSCVVKCSWIGQVVNHSNKKSFVLGAPGSERRF
jgi:hypothetical protein